MKNKLIGLIVGFTSGLFGAGGGMILVPAFLYFDKLDEKDARATTIFCILPIVLTSSIVYFNNHQFDWNIGIKCAIGGTIGAIIGSALLKKLDNKILSIMFLIFLIYVSIRMVFFS